MPFVSASIYHKASALAAQEGLVVSDHLNHQNSKELQEGSKYIPIELLYDVYELAHEHLSPGFGARQGVQLNSGDYGTLGLSWRTSWRAREILNRIERYMVLVTDQGSIGIEEKDGLTKLTLFRDPFRKGIETANEASFVMITSVLEEVTGRKIWPTRVTFTHKSQAVDEFEEFFQCPALFDSELNSLQFKTSDLDIPTIKADKNIQQFLDDRMDEEKQGIHSNADRLLSEVHQLIEESLPSGIPSVIKVADYLNMSPRTLKRRLSDKGLTFRDYVQKIQREAAIQLLKNSALSMAEIAFQTGFSEQSAFNRAFKRWTDQSPIDYRKNS